MIVRICSDLVAAENVHLYLTDLSERVLPLYRRAEGLQSVSVLRRHLIAYGEIATLSVWHSKEAMEDFCREPLPLPTGTVIRHEALVFDLIAM